MGSRRQFTQEFKLAAVRRLEQGVSIAEVARGLEVSPKSAPHRRSILTEPASDRPPAVDNVPDRGRVSLLAAAELPHAWDMVTLGTLRAEFRAVPLRANWQNARVDRLMSLVGFFQPLQLPRADARSTYSPVLCGTSVGLIRRSAMQRA